MNAFGVFVIVAILLASVSGQEDECVRGTPNCDDTGKLVTEGITLVGDTDLEVEWSVAKSPYENLLLNVGQSLRLRYFSSHNLYLMSDAALGDGNVCDFRGVHGPVLFLADGDLDGSGGTWAATFSKAGKYCFSSGVSLHCLGGLRMQVLVGDASDSDECSMDESALEFIPFRTSWAIQSCKRTTLTRQKKDSLCAGDLSLIHSSTTMKNPKKCFHRCQRNKLCHGYQFELQSGECLEFAFIPQIVTMEEDPNAEGFRCGALSVSPEGCDPTL